MTTQDQLSEITKEASGDLSADQYKFVDVDASDQATVVSSAGAEAIGVLQNDPSAQGRAATIKIRGTAKVEAGGSVTAGEAVASNASGQAVTATAASVDTTTSTASQDVAGDQVLGRALEDGASGEIIKIDYSPQGLT